MYQRISIGYRIRKQLAALSIQIPKSIHYWKRIKVDPNIKIEQNSAFIKGKVLHSMGAYSYSRSSLPQNTIVGRYCSIARNVTSLGFQHPLERFSTSSVTYSNDEFRLPSLPKGFLKTYGAPKPPAITIMNDVWIGNNAVLKPGIRIGNGAVIAANAVVTKDVPDYAIVGGIPAKVIRYRFTTDVIKALLALQWWDYDFLDFHDIPLDSDINSFIESLRHNIKLKSINKLSPNYFSVTGIKNSK
ncbi:CatB-related O-acetyltransferase [Shewanella colwelliana]|uniref:CatB-related O-acetyltransferase n=1 Tax=Shewanella colwelliana TaxID=23 RepID=UPI0022AF2F52|nr:CatB-related O-acetyltransferase [Shewanella colwelliana]